jgi:chorismate mutase/prephenate dehydratase
MTMPTLEKLRKQIDGIDKQVVELLDRRACLARKIGNIKRSRNIEFFDPSRQKNVLRKIRNWSDGSFPDAGLKTVFTDIMSACLAMEQQLRIGYFGAEGTFTHMAAVAEFGSAAQFISYKTIRDIFLAADKEWIDYGVVPIENSTGGVVHSTLDMFLEYDLKICSEVILYIRQNLLSRYPLNKIRVVYSNPQPFAQCDTWLRENLPRAELKEVATTVEGVRLAKRTRDAAAIGSELASRLYDLRIAARGIEDIKDNFTRFVVLGRKLSPPSGDDKTSLMCSVKDRPGALFRLLKPFADSKLNLTKIESRPSKRKAWEYVFFIDLNGYIEDTKVRKALDNIQEHCIFVKVLGSYPVEKNPVR